MDHRYDWRKGNGLLSMEVRTAGIGAVDPFAQIVASATNNTRIGKLDLRTRLFAQYGSGNTPRESQLYLASASPEEMMDDKYVRSIGFVPFDWMGYGLARRLGHQVTPTLPALVALVLDEPRSRRAARSRRSTARWWP